MPEKKQSEYCRYTTVKVDVEVMPFVKSAAALAGKSVQEFVSDLLNEATPKASGHKPVKRKQPPPRRPD